MHAAFYFINLLPYKVSHVDLVAELSHHVMPKCGDRAGQVTWMSADRSLLGVVLRCIIIFDLQLVTSALADTNEKNL